jgi:pimeloyl-ACP methyl ester carboxylesterase
MSLIHHVVTGNGQPPIVFVRGFACAHSDWSAPVAHLSTRHQTIAVDLSGHDIGSPNAAFARLMGRTVGFRVTRSAGPGGLGAGFNIVVADREARRLVFQRGSAMGCLLERSQTE